mmetsp:Transcript_110222/g.307128  ORF Transcript_110222/g.307128 Transcript_110222/m.307128 type:complete len:189 (+) Transcript_110222:95-661(+)
MQLTGTLALLLLAAGGLAQTCKDNVAAGECADSPAALEADEGALLQVATPVKVDMANYTEAEGGAPALLGEQDDQGRKWPVQQCSGTCSCPDGIGEYLGCTGYSWQKCQHFVNACGPWFRSQVTCGWGRFTCRPQRPQCSGTCSCDGMKNYLDCTGYSRQKCQQFVNNCGPGFGRQVTCSWGRFTCRR